MVHACMQLRPEGEDSFAFLSRMNAGGSAFFPDRGGVEYLPRVRYLKHGSNDECICAIVGVLVLPLPPFLPVYGRGAHRMILLAIR